MNAAREPTAQSHGIALWMDIHQLIQETINESMGQRGPRFSTITIAIAGAAGAPDIGWLTSVGVSFYARIVGVQMFSLVPGQMTIDIQRSTPDTHSVDSALPPADPDNPYPLQFASIIGDALPSINGVYAELLDTSLWPGRDLSFSDMLHFYVASTDGLLRSATMILYLQDLDEKV